MCSCFGDVRCAGGQRGQDVSPSTGADHQRAWLLDHVIDQRGEIIAQEFDFVEQPAKFLDRRPGHCVDQQERMVEEASFLDHVIPMSLVY